MIGFIEYWVVLLMRHNFWQFFKLCLIEINAVALQRISNLWDTQEARLLFNTIISIIISPIAWIFCWKRLNALVNNVHERVVYDGHSSSYSELLIAKNKTLTSIPWKSSWKNFYKFKNDLFPPLTDDIFLFRKSKL